MQEIRWESKEKTSLFSKDLSTYTSSKSAKPDTYFKRQGKENSKSGVKYNKKARQEQKQINTDSSLCIKKSSSKRIKQTDAKDLEEKQELNTTRKK